MFDMATRMYEQLARRQLLNDLVSLLNTLQFLSTQRLDLTNHTLQLFHLL